LSGGNGAAGATAVYFVLPASNSSAPGVTFHAALLPWAQNMASFSSPKL